MAVRVVFKFCLHFGVDSPTWLGRLDTLFLSKGAGVEDALATGRSTGRGEVTVGFAWHTKLVGLELQAIGRLPSR